MSGAWVSVRFFQLVTDARGRVYVELPAGEYEVEIQRGKGFPTITMSIEVIHGQSEVIVELEGRETSPEVPQIFIFDRFDEADSLVLFWTDQADTLRQTFGDIAAALLADGGYAVIKSEPPLQQAQEIAHLTARARDAGFTSSFTASKDAVAAVLVKSGELDQNVITETLIQLLESEDAGVRRNARTALSALGPVVVRQLIGTISGQSYLKDLGGMVALSEIKDWSARPEDILRLRKVASASDYKKDLVFQSYLHDALNVAFIKITETQAAKYNVIVAYNRNASNAGIAFANNFAQALGSLGFTSRSRKNFFYKPANGLISDVSILAHKDDWAASQVVEQAIRKLGIKVSELTISTRINGNRIETDSRSYSFAVKGESIIVLIPDN